MIFLSQFVFLTVGSLDFSENTREFLDVFEDRLQRKHLPEDIFIDQERRRPTTLRYRRGLNHEPCRLEIGGRLLCDSFST